MTSCRRIRIFGTFWRHFVSCLATGLLCQNYGRSKAKVQRRCTWVQNRSNGYHKRSPTLSKGCSHVFTKNTRVKWIENEYCVQRNVLNRLLGKIEYSRFWGRFNGKDRIFVESSKLSLIWYMWVCQTRKWCSFTVKQLTTCIFNPFTSTELVKSSWCALQKRHHQKRPMDGKMRVRLTKIAIDLHWRGGIVDKLLCYRESTNIQGLFV